MDREAAMSGEAALESERQDVSDYRRRLAAKIVMMLFETRVDAQRVLALADKMLNLEPPGEEPPAASAQTPA
jgi:hypothetical protein